MTSRYNSTKLTQCRICYNTSLVEIGDLGLIGISDFTEEPKKPVKLPLKLVYCVKCSLLQLGHDFNRDLLYKNYWYRSGLNKEIVEDLKSIAKEAQGEVHIDIGSNDGTLLKYSPVKFKIAVDPSNIEVVEPDTGLVTTVKIYWEDYYHEGVSFKADTITAIACIYDLPDPNKFMANVKKHLANDGIFIAQLMTLEPMIENNDVGNICHEHLEYYSYKSLVQLYEQNGLEIYRVEENGMNGGSYRLFARHLNNGSIHYKEKEYSVQDLRYWFKGIETIKQKFLGLPKYDKNIVGYGASTKMATITQYYGWSPEIVVDVNPDKIGKYTVTGSKIVDVIPVTATHLWVFPYGFIDYFKEKEKDYHGKWLTTIPNFQIQ